MMWGKTRRAAEAAALEAARVRAETAREVAELREVGQRLWVRQRRRMWQSMLAFGFGLVAIIVAGVGGLPIMVGLGIFVLTVGSGAVLYFVSLDLAQKIDRNNEAIRRLDAKAELGPERWTFDKWAYPERVRGRV